MLDDIFACVRISDLEPYACGGDNLTGFRILFHDFDQGFKCGIVDKITINLVVFTYKHIKGRQQLLAVPAFGLFYRVYSVWEQFRLGKTIRITDKDISLSFLCIRITSGVF